MPVTQRYIKTSPDRVFAVLADGWLYSSWVVGTSHMRAVEEDWPAKGSRLYHASGSWPMAVSDSTEVEAVEPDRRLVLVARAGAIGSARVDLTLRPDAAGGTVVAMDEYPVAGPGSWVRNPAVDRMLAWRNRESLHRLALLSERPTAPLDPD